MKKINKEIISDWWSELKELTLSEEITQKLIANKQKIKKNLASTGGKNFFYRITQKLFHLISRIAHFADLIAGKVLNLFARFPIAGRCIRNLRERVNNLKFRNTVEFIRTKIYSFFHPPHDENSIRIMDEFMDFIHRHGLDINRHIPGAKMKFKNKKNQLLQHKFFQEFSKSNLEKFLAIQFRFDRNIFPVLRDAALWHKFFEYLERKKVKDILLSGPDNERLSLMTSDPKEIASSNVVMVLTHLSEIKEKGRRIFFIGHHEGYLGPYFVRSVIRKLGFDNLAEKCNTIVGPRMLSNLVLRNGAANVGNLFITVPSQKTTEIKTTGLAAELKKTAKRTLALIKMPDSVLDLIQNMTLTEFKKTVSDYTSATSGSASDSTDKKKDRELADFFNDPDIIESIHELSEDDYNLFRDIMHEPFLIFPEGSRSYINPDGSISMKYINPRYFKAYMRPGDFIAPVNLVGGSDFTNGWHLSSAVLGISMGKPFEVTSEMIDNYEEEGLKVMRNIADLPNVKKVYFKDEIQNKHKT